MIVNINMDDIEWKRVNAQQPRRIRALMVRAQSLANAADETREHKTL